MIRKALPMIFLLACPNIFAEEPPANALHLLISFKGSIGAMDYFNPDEIPDNAAQSLNQLDYSITGGLRPRRGYNFFTYFGSNVSATDYGTTFGSKNNRFWIYRSTTNTGYFATRVDASMVFRGIDSDPTTGFQKNFYQAFSSGPIDSIQTNGDLYVVSETSPIIKFTEVATYNVGNPNAVVISSALISGSPAGTMIKPHLDRFLIAGSTIPGLENTVFFSSQDLITDWPPENTFDLFAKSGERITCIGDPIFGNAPIYTNKTTRLITGSEYPSDESPGNINVRLIYDGIGCASQQTVKNVRNTQYFYSFGQDNLVPGIYNFNGVSVKEKTKPIRRFFQNEVQNSTATLATAFVYKDVYCVNVATKGWDVLNTVVCVDESDRVWMYRPFWVEMIDQFNGVTYFYSNSARYIFGLANNPLNRIFKYDDPLESTYDYYLNTNAGAPAPFQWKYKTKDFSMDSQNQQNSSRTKNPDRVYIKTTVSTQNVILTVQANYDFGASSTIWNIDTSSFYKTGNITTVMKSSFAVVNRLRFPTGANGLPFNFIDFEVRGSSVIGVDYIDFYATQQVLK